MASRFEKFVGYGLRLRLVGVGSVSWWDQYI